MSQDEPERPRPIPVRPIRDDHGPSPPRAAPPPDGKPTPVREVMEVTDEPSETLIDPDVGAVEIEVDGREWLTRVRGRTLAGGSTHLLLLGFAHSTDAERDVLEGWVVGRALSELSPAVLEAAIRTGTVPREPGRRPFFDDGGRRERRDV